MSTETVVLAPMTRDYVDALMAHEQEMFGTEAWTPAGYRAELADRANRHYLVATDIAGTLLGWAGILLAGDQAEILTIGTVPAARRRGIATRLLNALLETARERGAQEVFLEVRVDNDGARRFYEREQFVSLGRRRGYYDRGRVDAVVMRREL